MKVDKAFIDTNILFGKPIHDANIVATMLVNGISTLLTTNVKDFERFEDVITLRKLG